MGPDNEIFMSEFQKQNQQFNNQILERSSNWGEKGMWDAAELSSDLKMQPFPKTKSQLMSKKKSTARTRASSKRLDRQGPMMRI